MVGLRQVVCGDGIHCARPLARRWLRYRRCYGWQRMTPARRAFHECRMQFPRTVSYRVSMSLELQRLWKLLKVHSVELHAKLLQARAACVPRRTRGSDGMRVGFLIRTGVRHFARGSDGTRVGGALAHI